MKRPALLLAAALFAASVAPHAQAQALVVVQEPGVVETAISACAGGAMIGVLAVWATGAPSPAGTAGLFCGLSVGATLASGVAVWTWRTVTSPFRS